MAATCIGIQRSTDQRNGPHHGAAARVVSIDAGTKYLNVTRLETVQIKVGGKSVTWMFDTLGTASFPLSKVIPGTDGVTVYVAENPAYIGG